jgi:type IV secretory pathway VirB10-like protein
MSAPVVKGTDAKAMLQDLKTNRKVQIALGALVLMIWYLWPTAPPVPANRKTAASRGAIVPLGDRQAHDLQKLPDLDKLNKAGELPTEDRMFRDLFLFEGPPPPPPPPLPPPPPPPPPTPEQLLAAKVAQERVLQSGTKPADLRYLGYLGITKGARYGAFMKGEDPLTYKQGDLVNPQWRLMRVTETFAEFQNEKFPDLKHRVDSVDPRGNAGQNAAPNEF